MGQFPASAAEPVPIARTAAGLRPKAVNQYPIKPLLPGGSAWHPIGSALPSPAAVVDTLQATAGQRQMAGTTTATTTSTATITTTTTTTTSATTTTAETQ